MQKSTLPHNSVLLFCVVSMMALGSHLRFENHTYINIS